MVFPPGLGNAGRLWAPRKTATVINRRVERLSIAARCRDGPGRRRAPSGVASGFRRRQARRLQRLRRRTVDDLAVAREHRAVARTIPRRGRRCSRSPCSPCACTRRKARAACRASSFQTAIFCLPCSMTPPSPGSIASMRVDQRLGVAAAIEMLRRAARRVVERAPRIGHAVHLVGDQHRGGRAVADAPAVEAGRDVHARGALVASAPAYGTRSGES